jgi:hypothetical protein
MGWWFYCHPILLRQSEDGTMEDNPYQSPPMACVATIAPSVRVRLRLRGIILLSFYLVVAANGAMQAFPLRGPGLGILLTVMAASLATYGCIVDSRLVGRPIVQSVHWIMFFTWPLAVPIYLIYSRGFLRGVGLFLLHGIGLIAACNAAFYLIWYLTYGRFLLERGGF